MISKAEVDLITVRFSECINIWYVNQSWMLRNEWQILMENQGLGPHFNLVHYKGVDDPGFKSVYVQIPPPPFLNQGCLWLRQLQNTRLFGGRVGRKLAQKMWCDITFWIGRVGSPGNLASSAWVGGGGGVLVAVRLGRGKRCFGRRGAQSPQLCLLSEWWDSLRARSEWLGIWLILARWEVPGWCEFYERGTSYSWSGWCIGLCEPGGRRSEGETFRPRLSSPWKARQSERVRTGRCIAGSVGPLTGRTL